MAARSTPNAEVVGSTPTCSVLCRLPLVALQTMQVLSFLWTLSRNPFCFVRTDFSNLGTVFIYTFFHQKYCLPVWSVGMFLFLNLNTPVVTLIYDYLGLATIRRFQKGLYRIFKSFFSISIYFFFILMHQEWIIFIRRTWESILCCILAPVNMSCTIVKLTSICKQSMASPQVLIVALMTLKIGISYNSVS